MAIRILSVNVSKTDGTAWATVDVQSLADDTQLAYEAYREAQEKARYAREAFEAMLRGEAGTDALKISHNFGKLSIAKGMPAAKAQAKPKVSLEDFLSGQRSNGARF